MKKAIVIDVDMGKSSHTASPPIKARLESSAKKKEKPLKLEEVIEKLEEAAKKREKLQKKRGEKLRTISKKSEEKVMRRHSCAEIDMKRQKDKVTEELAEADQRRRKRISSLVNRLRAEHEKVAEINEKIKEKKKSKALELKKKIDEKLENTETQRKKIINDMVKKLDEHNTEVNKRAENHKLKKKNQSDKMSQNCEVKSQVKEANMQKCMNYTEVEKK